MKTFLALLAVALVSTGCSISRIKGEGFSAWNLRGIWETREFSTVIPTVNGPLEIKLGGSNTDRETAQILSSLLINGLVAYRGGIPQSGQVVYVTNYVIAPRTTGKNPELPPFPFSPVPSASKGLEQ